MITISTTPTERLNASRVDITLDSAQEFGMQFSIAAFGKITDAEGNEVWGKNPLYSGLLNISGKTWDHWGSAVDDATYVGNLALAQLGLTRAPEEASEAPAEEAPEEAPAEKAEEAPAEE